MAGNIKHFLVRDGRYYARLVVPKDLRSYRDRLAQDEAARNQNAHNAQVGIDDGYLHNLREGIAGRLGDAALIELVSHRIEHFRNPGNTEATTGSSEWRALARAACISEYEALERLTERDEGNYAGEPKHALLRGADPVNDDFHQDHCRVSLETTMPHANSAARVSRLNVDGNRFLNRSVSICAMMMRGVSLRLI